jgi:hypothetical protein
MVNQPLGGLFRPQLLSPSNGPFGIACIDIDRDGRKDLVWGNDGREGAVDNTLSYVLNRGFDGSAVTFTQPAVLTIGFNPSDIAVADFDGNGADDLVVTLTDNNQVAILYNMHNGNSTSPVVFEQVRRDFGFFTFFFNSDYCAGVGAGGRLAVRRECGGY